MTHTPSGHIDQLPSGSWRAKVYAGKDPLTGRELRIRKTRKTEVEAQIELGRLLELARSGRNRDSGVTVAELLDAYVPVAGWELDNLYARLQKCGDLACAGKPFTEHRHVPDLRPGPADPRNGWQQAATKFREAIACGALAPGDDLPSVSELARLQGLKPGTIQHAFLELAKEGLLVIRHGRTAQVAGDAPAESKPPSRYRSARSRPGHDCTLSGCQPHVCRPMKPSTIHGIHSILSGAFEAAQRWELVDFDPAESAKPPSVRKKKTPATPPGAVVAVIEQARNAGKPAMALYVWLAAIELNIKALRHYTASQLLAAGFDLGNTAARLGHSGGGATTLRHYADPVPEADRRAATYLSRLTSNAAAAAETRRQQLVPPGGAEHVER